MYIAIKDTKIIGINDVEWECRREAKGLDTPSYWTWLDTVTSGEPPVSDFSGEDYEIVQTDAPLPIEPGYISSTIKDGTSYHLKWDASKKEIVKDDTAKAAWELAQEWKQIRKRRTRLLEETDWTQGGDSPLTTQKKSDWAKYRTSLRTLPEDQSSKTKYSDITWPTKPS